MTRDINTIYLSSADDQIANIYHLLDLARDRPGMYGIGGRSFRLLHAFLGGLAYANLNPGDPPFSDFDWWATVRTDHVGTSMPWRWLEIEQPDEQAYAMWFALLDEYRACRIVELARLPGSMVKFRACWTLDTSTADRKMEPYVPPTPQFIRLGQFAPSDVYFAEQLFENRGEKLIQGFQPSAEKAILEAQQAWQVDLAAWNYPIGEI